MRYMQLFFTYRTFKQVVNFVVFFIIPLSEQLEQQYIFGTTLLLQNSQLFPSSASNTLA